MNPTPNNPPGESFPWNHSGFTLVELLVGITVSSILLLALFQLLSDLTSIRSTYRTQAIETHQEVALRRLLYQDLYSIPVTEVNFQGTQDEFYRTTVAHSQEKNRLLETRVHYYTRRSGGELNLLREWKWVDLHEDFGKPEKLLSARSISFTYITESARSINNSNATDEKIAGVRLKIDDRTITVPAGLKPSKEEKSKNSTRGKRKL